MTRQPLTPLLCVCLSAMICASAAWAQKAPKKVMDAFERQKLEAKVEHDPVSGKLTIEVDAKLACYPNGTSILVTIHYIQGETTKEHEFGVPEQNRKDGTSRRIASKTVVVRDWRYTVRFTFDKYCPPGEYVVTGFYRMSAQKRKLQRQFKNEYVPPHERKNPCQFCRFHYGLAKIQIADPKFKLRPKYVAMKDVPMWKKQKLDYVDRMISAYKDWYAQILGAREAMRMRAHQILRFGPTEQAMVHEEVAKVIPSAQREMHAIISWKAVNLGLKGCREMLEQNKRLPNNPHQFWRLVAFGDGHPPEQDLRDPSPGRGSANRPWTYNYIIPRLAYVSAEMMQHKSEVSVLIAPNTFFEIRNLGDRIKGLVLRTDKQIDIAVDTLLEEKKLDNFDKADEQAKAKLSEELIATYYDVFHKMHVEKAKASHEIEKELERMQKMLEIKLRFPVPCWPLPVSIMEAPQNPAEELKKKIQETFGALMKEAATGKKGGK